MTIKKAIEIVLNRGVGYTVEDGEIAFNMAIKALEQEQSGDAISRQAVLELVNKGYMGLYARQTDIEIMKDKINELSSVTPQFYPPCEDCNYQQVYKRGE